MYYTVDQNKWYQFTKEGGMPKSDVWEGGNDQVDITIIK